jgi:hypothetical protein
MSGLAPSRSDRSHLDAQPRYPGDLFRTPVRRGRKTLALLGGDLCETAEHYKAWSQNLGHDHVLTTFTSYGDVSGYRQAEIIRNLGRSAGA